MAAKRLRNRVDEADFAWRAVRVEHLGEPPGRVVTILLLRSARVNHGPGLIARRVVGEIRARDPVRQRLPLSVRVAQTRQAVERDLRGIAGLGHRGSIAVAVIAVILQPIGRVERSRPSLDLLQPPELVVFVGPVPHLILVVGDARQLAGLRSVVLPVVGQRVIVLQVEEDGRVRYPRHPLGGEQSRLGVVVVTLRHLAADSQ